MSIQEHYMLTRKTMRYLATQKCARDTQKRGLGRVITRRNTRREGGRDGRETGKITKTSCGCLCGTNREIGKHQSCTRSVGAERERSKRTRKHKQTKRENEKFFFTSG